MIKKQKGFLLIAAVFILVVLSLVATYIVSISSLTVTSGNLSLMGVKAYFAAKSGMEWGIYKTTTLNAGSYNCPASPSSFSLTQTGLSGFSVTVTCTAFTFTEGSNVNYKIFQITSTAQYGNPSDYDYASRVIYTTVIQPGVS